MVTAMNYRFSGPGAMSPAKGAKVCGSIYIPNPIPTQRSIHYQFHGEYIGECADGFMVRPEFRSDGGALDTIFCRLLSDRI